MKTPKDPRHKARLRIVAELFSHSFKDQNISTKSKKIINSLSAIDPLIREAAPQFPLDKIAKVDLAILRLAVYELIIEKKEPPKVIIDEAVEIAKSLGGEGSPPFINGVLGTVYNMQTNESFDKKLEKLLRDKLSMDDDELNLKANLETDLGLAEVEKADLIAQLEKDLNFTIEDKHQLSSVKTLEDLIHLVEENSHEF